MRTFTVYILTNRSGTLYVGVTSKLDQRLNVHQARLVRGFSAKYHCDRLVYVEQYPTARDAIAREKQLKGWRRAKKIALIEAQNPTWRDLGSNQSHSTPSPGEPRRWARGARRGMSDHEAPEE